MMLETRLIRYFVEEKGFRQIYVENDLYKTEPATQYVRNGKGTARSASEAFKTKTTLPNIQMEYF